MTARVDDVFAALADPTRRGLLDRLVAGGPDTATRLSDDLPVSRQAVVKHLQVLAGAGLLSSERDGREVRWIATPAGLDGAVAWMIGAGAAWDRRLERLHRNLRKG